MRVRLGYVAVPVTLDITSSSIVTYTHYKKLGVKRGNEKLDKVIMSNFDDLKKILFYNIKNEIYFFRMTSRLIPLGTHPDVDYEIFSKYKQQFLEIGKIINDNNLRVDTHPDQFCVLNSINEDVVKSSINILKFHQSMFKAMEIDGKIIIHVGSATKGKREGMKRFIENFLKLDESLQHMILVENDDKTYNIRNVLKLCNELNIPMVLDYHHYLCNNNGEKITDYLDKIYATWDNQKLRPKMHFSSPKNKKEKRSHSEYINSDDFIKFLDKIKIMDRDVDVMLEAKGKDEALFRLIRQLKYKKEYKFINNTVFLI